MLLSPEIKSPIESVDSLIDEEESKRAAKDSVRNLISSEEKQVQNLHYKKLSTIDAALPQVNPIQSDPLHKANTITETMVKMIRLSSFIHNNYESPNIKDIEKERRRREIEEIDVNVQRRKFDTNSKSVSGTMGEIIEQHPTAVDKSDFRKSHTYA